MIALAKTLLVVVVGDQILKLLLRRFMGPASLPLGPFGNVRMVPGQIWVRRFGGYSGAVMWAFWAAAAVVLVIVSTSVPSSQVFVGLLLGGSLSNALES